GERLLILLDTAPEDLPSAERLARYQMLRPDLAELYELDPVACDLVIKAIVKKLKVKARSILRDIQRMVPPDEESGTERQPERGPTQAAQLVALAADAEFFHPPDGEAWATTPVDGHREHWPLKVRAFRRWLIRRFYQQEKKVPGAQALQDALGVLEGKALFDGSEHPIFMRVAEHNGTIYLDLCNKQWEAIEISSTGWRVVANPPVRFRRAKGMLPLPHPVAGGTVKDLRRFVNVRSEEDWVLLVSWL